MLPGSARFAAFCQRLIRVPVNGRLRAWPLRDTPKMAIKASKWCNSFRIWWADDDLPGLTDDGYRMKIMEGGVLVFEGKPAPSGAFLVVAPHAWTRLKTPSLAPMAINVSDWCNSF